MLTARRITEYDYNNTLTKWWQQWRWSAPSLEFLPEDGVIVSYDGIDVCACYVYNTSSKVLWMEFIISNMDVKDRDIRDLSMSYMFQVVKSIASNFDKKYIMCNTKNQSLVNRLAETGYQKGSERVTEMIYIL